MTLSQSDSTIIVAVGSKRRPKLDAARQALALLAPKLGGESHFEVLGVDVPSGVRHTPLNRQDTMAGARHRADALATIALEKREAWNYFLGLEGGLDVVWSQGTRSVFLQNWAYVTEGSGRGAFGQSGSILLPEPLAQRVVEEGVELSEAIDELAGSRGIRDSTGAWGILSGGLISRKDAFCVAVINAFAPFINREMYGLTKAT